MLNQKNVLWDLFFGEKIYIYSVDCAWLCNITHCPFLENFVQKLFIISWVLVHICAPVKFLTFFPTWASNRNLIFQAKLQNSLCSCTSWGYMYNTNEICDTYPESSWYKLLKNARKSWSNHKSYCTLLNNFGQKYSKTDTVILWEKNIVIQKNFSRSLNQFLKQNDF